MASDNRVVLNPNFSQCSICLEDFNQPKFLDCHHTFCKECIRDLEKKSPGTVSCPLCQRKNQIPAGGVEQLTSNFYILNLNTNKPEDGLQTVRSDGIQKSKEVFNRKTIYVAYKDDVEAEFNGITFILIIREHNLKWGNTLSVNIRIVKASSPFVESCDIDYDISLVNQIDRDYSVRQTGNRQVAQKEWMYDWIHLIKLSDAVDVDNGFIVKQTTDVNSQTIKTVQLDVEIKVKSKKMKNFNLNLK